MVKGSIRRASVLVFYALGGLVAGSALAVAIIMFHFLVLFRAFPPMSGMLVLLVGGAAGAVVGLVTGVALGILRQIRETDRADKSIV
jgi:hypothetical protein